MIFRPELADAIRDGKKTVTRRRSDRYRVGRTYAVQPGRGKRGICRVLVTSVKREESFEGHISDAEAIREGFRPTDPYQSPAALFLRTWRDIHGDIQLDVYRVEFTLVSSTESEGR